MLGAPAGSPARITPDLIVVNDGICHTAVEMANLVRSPDKVRVIFDHDVPTGRPEAARVFAASAALPAKTTCGSSRQKG